MFTYPTWTMTSLFCFDLLLISFSSPGHLSSIISKRFIIKFHISRSSRREIEFQEMKPESEMMMAVDKMSTAGTHGNLRFPEVPAVNILVQPGTLYTLYKYIL